MYFFLIFLLEEEMVKMINDYKRITTTKVKDFSLFLIGTNKDSIYKNKIQIQIDAIENRHVFHVSLRVFYASERSIRIM